MFELEMILRLDELRSATSLSCTVYTTGVERMFELEMILRLDELWSHTSLSCTLQELNACLSFKRFLGLMNSAHTHPCLVHCRS